jgi:dihydroflavonol-4-reductase
MTTTGATPPAEGAASGPLRCAVTGGNGFVGSHLIDRLLANGHPVTALLRKTADRRWLEGKPVRIVEGDVEDGAALEEAFASADLVFHLAGLTSATSREAFLRVNAGGARRAAEAALRATPRMRRFVLVSSMAAIGPGAGEAPLDETTPEAPINGYGESKLEAERAVRSLAPALPLAIVRPGAIYGPRDRDMLILLKLAAAGFRVKVGLARRTLNFGYVEDVVEGIVLAATRPEALGETFLIGAAENHSLLEAGRLMVQATRGRGSGATLWLPVSVAYAAGALNGAFARLSRGRPTLNIDRIRLLTARNWSMNIGKARRLLGYEPRFGLVDGAAKTWTWHRGEGASA